MCLCKSLASSNSWVSHTGLGIEEESKTAEHNVEQYSQHTIRPNYSRNIPAGIYPLKTVCHYTHRGLPYPYGWVTRVVVNVECPFS